VQPGLPGASAGLQRGDVVVKMNDQDVDSPGKLRYLAGLADPGDTIKVSVLRDGKSQVIPVKVGDSSQLDATETASTAATPANPANPAARGNGQGRRGRGATLTGDTTVLTGVGLDQLTDDARTRWNIPDDIKGVEVTGVLQTSPFADDFVAGVTVMEVNKQAVATVDALHAQLKPGVVNVFYVYYQGHYAYVGEPISAQK
jgi:S1-C subfamily serine protease